MRPKIGSPTRRQRDEWRMERQSSVTSGTTKTVCFQSSYCSIVAGIPASKLRTRRHNRRRGDGNAERISARDHWLGPTTEAGQDQPAARYGHNFLVIGAVEALVSYV